VTLRDEVTQLLQELIRLDTVNPPGNETQAAELLRDYLAGHGVESELYARTPERANLVARLSRGVPVGQLLVILTAGIDLSVGSVLGLGGELEERDLTVGAATQHNDDL